MQSRTERRSARVDRGIERPDWRSTGSRAQARARALGVPVVGLTQLGMPSRQTLQTRA